MDAHTFKKRHEATSSPTVYLYFFTGMETMKIQSD